MPRGASRGRGWGRPDVLGRAPGSGPGHAMGGGGQEGSIAPGDTKLGYTPVPGAGSQITDRMGGCAPHAPRAGLPAPSRLPALHAQGSVAAPASGPCPATPPPRFPTRPAELRTPAAAMPREAPPRVTRAPTPACGGLGLGLLRPSRPPASSCFPFQASAIGSHPLHKPPHPHPVALPLRRPARPLGSRPRSGSRAPPPSLPASGSPPPTPAPRSQPRLPLPASPLPLVLPGPALSHAGRPPAPASSQGTPSLPSSPPVADASARLGASCVPAILSRGAFDSCRPGGVCPLPPSGPEGEGPALVRGVGGSRTRWGAGGARPVSPSSQWPPV